MNYKDEFGRTRMRGVSDSSNGENRIFPFAFHFSFFIFHLSR
jgi:hypothetical protein